MRTTWLMVIAVFVASTGLALCESIETVRFGAIAGVGVPPYQSKGTVMVPMRAMFEWLGAEVSFDSATSLITAKRGEQVVSLKPGDSIATVNGEKMTMSVPAESRDGQTFVPVRFVAEAFDTDVKWDSASQRLTVADGDRKTELLLAAKPPALGKWSGEVSFYVGKKGTALLPHLPQKTCLAFPRMPWHTFFVGNWCHNEITIKKNASGRYSFIYTGDLGNSDKFRLFGEFVSSTTLEGAVLVVLGPLTRRGVAGSEYTRWITSEANR